MLNKRDKEPYKLYRGKPEIKGINFLNLVSVVHAQDIKVESELLAELLDWQKWALRPDLFDLEWLHIFYHDHIHEHFAKKST